MPRFKVDYFLQGSTVIKADSAIIARELFDQASDKELIDGICSYDGHQIGRSIDIKYAPVSNLEKIPEPIKNPIRRNVYVLESENIAAWFENLDDAKNHILEAMFVHGQKDISLYHAMCDIDPNDKDEYRVITTIETIIE